MGLRVGVASIQGDFEKHLRAIREADPTAEAVEVRTVEDLAAVDRMIIPGGESTTVGMLMQRFGLGEALRARAAQGMPLWGTCMGMILLARRIEDRPDQFTLGLLDITVRRNAFGAQVHSFEDEVAVEGFEHPVTGVFIRAPEVTQWGDAVQPLARYGERVVAVRQGSLVGTSFHPELTEDRSFHRWFLSL